MSKIDNKVVWITGASSGIGEALTYALSKRGCKLIISARNTAQLEEVKRRSFTPDAIEIVPLDLAEHHAMPQKVDAALKAFGAIDILVNNAGISQRSLIAETTFEVYKKLMDINYLGTVALTKALLPHFQERASGHFAVVTSVMGKFGSPYRSGYCGAKHALHGFFDVLRMEHEKDQIHVSMICPGFVQTNVAKNALTADGSAQNTDDEATQKGITPHALSQRLIRAIEQKKFEVYVGKKEVAGVYLKRFFPKFLHKFVLRSKVR
ncbi:SDR family oxidoreductase [Spongiimicrobium salis]|uniref:SDR family oxidoreductase n=1 Tax=Spongiimicrobium salis TaxID=1667022 RepID=UPI00374CCBBA